MLSPMPVVAFTLCAAYLFGLWRLLDATLVAPIGYEDEDGFHYGAAIGSSLAVRNER